MTGRIKLAVLIMLMAVVFAAMVFYMYGRELYKDYSLRGTFVFETLEEEDTCLFI